MQLTHLGLPVRDAGRSLRFYAEHFGFDPVTAQEYDDGTVIVRNGDGFDLAFHQVLSVGELPEFLHFGFRVPSPSDVERVITALERAGVRIVEHCQEPTLVSVKCLDPDGHRVEVYWEAPRSS